MLGGCLSSATYPLKADIYTKQRTTNKSGQIVDKWQFWKTIDCGVIAFSSTSFKAQSLHESFGTTYEKSAYVTLKTKEPLSRSVRVTNIRDRQGTVIYKELELKNNPPTWFNANGSNPRTDPFGSTLEYETLLNRSEQQGELA